MEKLKYKKMEAKLCNGINTKTVCTTAEQNLV